MSRKIVRTYPIKETPDEGFIKAAIELQSYVNNKRNYSTEPVHLHSGSSLRESFRFQNRRREYFIDCKFYNSDLTGAGFSGAIFKNCSFAESDLSLVNMNSCRFESCCFASSLNVSHANFSSSTFLNCDFNGLQFSGVHFEGVLFKECRIQNCVFDSANLENAHFDRVLLEAIRFKRMNLEFVHLDSIQCNDVRFPFPSLPYVFNGLKYLSNTQDFVTVTSHKDKASTPLTREEYIELLPILHSYFQGASCFFPLANILIAESNVACAKEAVINGIAQSLAIRDYRMVRYYCMLSSENNLFSPHEAMGIYFDMLENTQGSTLSKSDRYSFEEHRPAIESLLLAGCGSTIDFMIRTKIVDISDYRINVLLSTMEQTIKRENPHAVISYTLKHCCPVEVFVIVATEPQYILGIVAAALFIITGTASKLYQSVIKCLTDTYSMLKSREEYKSLKRQNSISIEKEEHCEDGAAKIFVEQKYTDMRQAIIADSIPIDSVCYNISNVDESFAPLEVRSGIYECR